MSRCTMTYHLLKLRKSFILHLLIFHIGFMDAANFAPELFGVGNSMELIMMIIKPK